MITEIIGISSMIVLVILFFLWAYKKAGQSDGVLLYP